MSALKTILSVIVAVLPTSCGATDSMATSACDDAAALVATQYSDHRSESDESLVRKTGHSRLYYQAVLESELTDERVKALIANPQVSSSVLASLSLAGEADKLSKLVRSGLGANVTSDEGVPVLVIAAGCKRVDAVNELLSTGADIYAHDRQNIDAMAAAILEDSDVIVRTLVAHGYKVNREKESGKITDKLARSLHNGKYSKLLEP